MRKKKNILAIVGSASANSTNHRLVAKIENLTKNEFCVTIVGDLKILPHFDPEQSLRNPPAPVVEFKTWIERADGVIICTPEYIFSIPGGLKNALEWCVSSTVFAEKPTGIVTASANGLKGHEELQLIMKTLMAKFNSSSTLLIQGVKGKFDELGNIIDPETSRHLEGFVKGFIGLVNNDSKE